MLLKQFSVQLSTSTWRCMHSPAARHCCGFAAVRPAGRRYRSLHGWRSAANPQQRRANAGTDRRTDAGQLHRPCCAYYAGSTSDTVDLCGVVITSGTWTCSGRNSFRPSDSCWCTFLGRVSAAVSAAAEAAIFWCLGHIHHPTSDASPPTTGAREQPRLLPTRRRRRRRRRRDVKVSTPDSSRDQMFTPDFWSLPVSGPFFLGFGLRLESLGPIYKTSYHKSVLSLS